MRLLYPLTYFATGTCLTFAALSVQASLDPNPQDGPQRPRFAASVDLVAIDIAVVDEQGIPVEDLLPGELTVSFDGAEYEPEFLLPNDAISLDIMLLIDLSSSMERQPWRDNALHFLESLAPRDCVLLAGFSTATAGFLWGSPLEERLSQALYASETAGETALYDGLLAGLAHLTNGWVRTMATDLQILDSVTSFENAMVQGQEGGPCPVALDESIAGGGRPVRRKVIVVITDGLDSVSVHGRNDVLLASHSAGIPVFGLLEVPRTGTVRGSVRASNFRSMLLESGGRYLAPGYESVDKLLSWLRGTHVVGFYLSPGAATQGARFVRHELAIAVARRGVDVIYSPVHYRADSNHTAGLLGAFHGLEAMRSYDDEAALDALNSAILSNRHSASAYFLRAQALARLGRKKQALSDASEAVALAPGVAQGHTLVADLALTVGEYQLAWDEAIRATQAGAEMSALRERLARVSAPPADLEARLELPRIAVEKAAASAAANLLVEAASQTAIQEIRGILSTSPRAALTTKPQDAVLRLRVAGIRVSEELPRRFHAELELLDRDDKRIYRTTVDFEDINDEDSRARDLSEAIGEVLMRILERARR